MQSGPNSPIARSLRAVAAALAVLCVAAWASPAAPAASTPPCGTRPGSAPATYAHVIVIMEENRSSSDVIGGAGSAAARAAPYLNSLAATCGLATNYHGATHPSHPNYMAVTGGVATTLPEVNAPSIFGQIRSAGRTWRVYEQAMARNCQHQAAFPYKPQHNPGVAYRPLAADCGAWDTNMQSLQRDIAANTLPAYAFVAADQCHDMELACTSGAGAVQTGDAWLEKWVPRLVGSAAYQAGRTAILITWDEGAHGTAATNRGEDCLAAAHLADISCHVATLVVSPYVSRGLRSGALFSHYSLLQTTERLLGLRPFLGRAGDSSTAGMRSAFGF